MKHKLARLKEVLHNVFGNRRALYYYVQKSIRNPSARKTLASAIRTFLPKPGPSPADTTLAARVRSNAERLRTDGFVIFNDLLTSKQIEEARAYLMQREAYDISMSGNRVPHRFRAPYAAPPEVTKARYDTMDVLNCPHLLAVANHPLVLGSVERVLGCKPTITVIQAWWSLYRATALKSGQKDAYVETLFHRDVEDYDFMTMFMYLTDVDDGTGPHVFVRSSHESRNLVARKPFTEEEVRRHFGEAAIMRFTGPAGTTILERTWGVHRATAPLTGNRLMFSVTYCLTGMPLDTPKEPFPVPVGPYDPYVNRAYLRG